MCFSVICFILSCSLFICICLIVNLTYCLVTELFELKFCVKSRIEIGKKVFLDGDSPLSQRRKGPLSQMAAIAI